MSVQYPFELKVLYDCKSCPLSKQAGNVTGIQIKQFREFLQCYVFFVVLVQVSAYFIDFTVVINMILAVCQILNEIIKINYHIRTVLQLVVFEYFVKQIRNIKIVFEFKGYLVG